ncbi:DUF1963 domain-containing protein [Streptomyces milbemycinicus]|uniref:DUF1963 domain-containing protein n=1 Tax=Streptomyces milbemycinicus TaxID=476552 RepID=A0ABW8LPW8_9ACTN
MDPKTTLAALRDFCVEHLGADLADRVIGLARPGFELTEAAPGQAAGHSRFGGRAMLEPGTPWPMCEDIPLSLLAVLDTDALAPWLDDLLPPGTGLLNFFHLDTESEQCDPEAWEVARGFDTYAPEVGTVIAARSTRAVETDPPARSSVFAPVPWAAELGFALPDYGDAAWDMLDLGYEGNDYEALETFKGAIRTEWFPPGLLFCEDMAFGRPVFPTGSSSVMLNGDDSNRYHHLLQLSDRHEWRLDGEGGWMHWSIPTEALRARDFSEAIPTPDYW